MARALFSSLGSRGFRGLPAGKRKKTASFLSVHKATLGTTGSCPEFRPSLPFCLSVAKALFSSLGSRGVSRLAGGQEEKTASFLPVQKATLGTTGSCPSSVLHCHGRCFRALAAVDFEACRRARGKGQLVLVGAESDVRHYRPLPGGPFRPSLPFCLSVARALFSSLGSRGFRGLPAGKRKRGKSFF